MAAGGAVVARTREGGSHKLRPGNKSRYWRMKIRCVGPS